MERENERTILEVVTEVAARATDHDISQIDASSDLIYDLEMDSLGIFETTVDLEEHFGIQIDDEALDDIQTIGDIVSYIERVLLAEEEAG